MPTNNPKLVPAPEPEDHVDLTIPADLDRRKVKPASATNDDVEFGLPAELDRDTETVSAETATVSVEMASATEEQLDEEEREFRALRVDVPGVKGAGAIGIIAISVGKTPTKNEFFRTHPTFRPIVPIVEHEVGMDKAYFAVTKDMVEALAAIDIRTAYYTLYLTVTAAGSTRVVPVRHAHGDDAPNEYNRTKEIALVDGIKDWVRLSTDQVNRCYKSFPAHAGRFGEPQWPELKPAKIFKLAFRDKGRLIDSTEHPLFKKWAARDKD